MKKIQSVLIANRGEIAVRIAKTLQRMQIKVYVLTSDLDQNAYHTQFADEVLLLKGSSLQETYLNIDQLIQLMKTHKIDAVHPGYGFLSENAEFVQACQKHGVIFIGPKPQTIAEMGSKAHAKALMQKAGVPTIPGYNGDDQSLETLLAEAKKIKIPLLVKASAGGGGKGMRVVSTENELERAMESAKSEAIKSFGDDRLILEKYIENPRHIEFQIFGDSKGNLIHLGERECSIQRRHQKIIEETPSLALDEKLRQEMAQAALDCGQALCYENAGTVEFILGEDKKFYFLEVNTRLQVEHPITEWRTGLDLVEWQIRVAQGESLPLKQEQISFVGHALECRVYAEDAENQFLPSIGEALFYEEPTAPFLRIDSGIDGDSEITLNFDPMISKVSVFGATREEAISRMIWTLENYPVLGVKTNGAFLLEILRHAEFQKGITTTNFIPKYFENWKDVPDEGTIALLSHIAMKESFSKSMTASQMVPGRDTNLWDCLKGFRVGLKS